MGRLNRYILREHHGPFWLSLIVVLLVLVTDFIPDVVRMVVSKGLSTWIIAQVFVLNLAWMTALAVPMAVLSGTLMAFGRLSADSETLAMKAAGMSLYRLIAPILVAAAILAVALVVFNNEVLPDANHKARQLMSDIKRKRPTLDLRPNVMEDRIPGYHLLIKELDPRSSDIADITIFDHKNRAALRTVVAKTGTMRNSDDGNTLILELHDGEIHEPDPGDRQKYRRTAFQSQTFYLGGVGDEFTRSESSYRTDREKSAAQMREDVEAWTATLQSRWRTLNHACSTMIAAYFLELPDSLNPDVSLPIARASFQGTRHPRHILERARDRVNRVNSIIERETAAIRNQQRLINQHLIEIYKKYSIPVACLSFALIACPLAARSRRRGIGSGLGISLGLFLVYWAFLIGGEDLADRGIVTPFTAMWSADILIAVIGLALLWSVANEVPLSPRAVWHWIRRHIGGGTGSTKETGR